MNQQKEQFLNLHTTPARMGAEEVAWYLGFSPHEIPILMSAGLLKPLGHPPANGTKFFATAAIQELRQDMKWLARASDVIVEYWKTRNDRKKTVRQEESNGVPSAEPSTRSRPSPRFRSSRVADVAE